MRSWHFQYAQHFSQYQILQLCGGVDYGIMENHIGLVMINMLHHFEDNLLIMKWEHAALLEMTKISQKLYDEKHAVSPMNSFSLKGWFREISLSPSVYV